MSILKAENLYEKYESFELKDATFSLEEGKITGCTNGNGADKSTMLKSLFNFVHPNSGEIIFFDKDCGENELEIKQKVGFVSDGIDYYSKRKIKIITDITNVMRFIAPLKYIT